MGCPERSYHVTKSVSRRKLTQSQLPLFRLTKYIVTYLVSASRFKTWREISYLLLRAWVEETQK